MRDQIKSGFQIAIDGPVAAGKSTVAKKVAEKLGFLYVDTGAMYRAVTLNAMDKGLDIGSEDELVKLVKGMDIVVRLPKSSEADGRLSTVLVNGEDVSLRIRSEAVSCVVAKVAALTRVREVLVPKQREVAKGQVVVMEGRDITYKVLPDADLKIYLDASVEVRIERYHRMLKNKGEEISRSEAAIALRSRDELDINRAASPLKKVTDAWVLDSSDMSIEEVVDMIVERVKEMRNS